MSLDMPSRKRRRGKPRGGKGGAESRAAVEAREHEVLERRAQRQSQREIAEALKISQAAVSKILRRLSQRWARANTALLEQHRFEASATYGRMLREAFAAWEQSRAPRVRKRHRKQEGRPSVSEVIVEEGPGDPRFLEQFANLLDRLHRVQGVPDATKAPVIGMEYSAEFQRELEGARERLGRQLDVMLSRALEMRERQEEGGEDPPGE